jgi:hypothetical protein
MERKNTGKKVVTKSEPQIGKEKLAASASKFRRTNESQKVKAKNVSISPDSSGSDSPDEDYAEFLKTYDPQESYPGACSAGEEEGSQITVESKEKPRKTSKTNS